MTRLLLTVWLLAAALAAFVLFEIKHEVQTLEDDLRSANRQIAQDKEAIRILKAEWSYLNQPHRLESLASKHLDLKPIGAGQIGVVHGLDPRPEDFGHDPQSLPEFAIPMARQGLEGETDRHSDPLGHLIEATLQEVSQ